MGFNEDDRIRNKNRHYNLAADLYSSLRLSMTDSDIMAFVEAELSKEQTDERRKTLLIVQDYASRIPENYN